MRLLARHDLGGFGNCGEGVSMQLLPDGRRLLYIAHVQGPKEYSVLDVTEPSEPRLVHQTELPHANMRPNSLAVLDNLLLQCYQVSNYGDKPAGVAIIDVEEPENPRQIGFFDTSGPGSVGTHSVWFVDGRYAHIASGMPDWTVRDERDRGQFYVAVDLQDPTNPVEAGRWWLPGTREGDTEPPQLRHDQDRDRGYRLHNVHVYPERPDRAYLGYVDGGAIILDISDMANPKMIARNDYHPPISVAPIAQPDVSLGYTHTVFPLFSTDILVVSDEAGRPNGGD